jgi:hypothetical protein
LPGWLDFAEGRSKGEEARPVHSDVRTGLVLIHRILCSYLPHPVHAKQGELNLIFGERFDGAEQKTKSPEPIRSEVQECLARE